MFSTPGQWKEAVCNSFFRLFQGMKGEKKVFQSYWKAALSHARCS